MCATCFTGRTHVLAYAICCTLLKYNVLYENRLICVLSNINLQNPMFEKRAAYRHPGACIWIEAPGASMEDHRVHAA